MQIHKFMVCIKTQKGTVVRSKCATSPDDLESWINHTYPNSDYSYHQC